MKLKDTKDSEKDKSDYKINTVKKLVYYLFEEGSRARKVIGNFLSGSKGAKKTDGYNSYKMVEGERRMKPVVLGRMNYMNYGSHQGASNGAYMYTLVESCKTSGTSPVAYIKDVLCSLKKGETDYLQLIPCNWIKINKIKNMLFNNISYLPVKSGRQPNIERLHFN